MKFTVLLSTLVLLVFSTVSASALQCVDVIGLRKTAVNASSEKTYDKVLKNYLMVNLTYPQNDVGVSYVLVGLLLSGKATYQDIVNSLYRAPEEKLHILYKSMQNTHAAHGVLKDVPFSRIVKLTQNIENKVDFILMSTFSVLFPDYIPSGQNPSQIIQEFMAVLNSEQTPQTLKIRAYGELILSSLRDKEAMAYAKEYRRNFAESGRLQLEDLAARDAMATFLQTHIRTKLEEAFPETQHDIGPMHDGLYRPLSEAIGGIF
jgi:hypothetical protein